MKIIKHIINSVASIYFYEVIIRGGILPLFIVSMTCITLMALICVTSWVESDETMRSSNLIFISQEVILPTFEYISIVLTSLSISFLTNDKMLLDGYQVSALLAIIVVLIVFMIISSHKLQKH